MNLNEFVRLNPKEIRASKELMQTFILLYESAFSFKPSCAGCTFKKGFNKLKSFAKSNKKILKFDEIKVIMKNTFLLKKQYKLKILTYKKDGKIYRSYGYNLTEDFATQLVANGKSELFSTLPKVNKKEPIAIIIHEDIEVDDIIKTIKTDKEPYEEMDYRAEVLPLYSKTKKLTGEKAKSNKKVDIIKFLEDNES
jgi:hypothetical protein